MKHIYLCTLEIVQLKVGEVYDELLSHLTLMSRFVSELSPVELAAEIRPLFASTLPVHIVFGATVELGPKKVAVHMVDSPDERCLHEALYALLDGAGVEYQYPEFIGDLHKAHVTRRAGMSFEAGSELVASAAYLIEVVNGRRAVRAKLMLGVA